MAKTYTVKWGDTLWDIAKEHNTTYQTLAKINNLDIVKKNGQDYVYLTVGQVIKLVDDGSSSSSTKVTGDTVKIRTYGLQSHSERGMYVTWNWDRANTKEYKVEWYDYYDGYWHKHESTVTVKNSEFTANNEATQVKVKIKPVAKTYKNSKGKEVAYWTNVKWASSNSYSFSENPPKKPTSAPKIEIADTKLSATLDGLSDLNSPSIIEFQLATNEVPTSTKVKVPVKSLISVTAEFTVKIGSNYRVRARTVRGVLTSAWSDWSESKSTIPAVPEITKCMAGSADNTVELSWTSVTTATAYEIEYADNQSYFTNPTGGQPYSLTNLTEEQIKTCKAVISDNITSEKNFYFRMRAKNDVGYSAWSNVSQYKDGDAPKAPTTFSSRSVITVGNLVTLNWTHNSTGEAVAKYSHIDLYVDGVKKLIPTIDHGTEKNNEKSYTIDTRAEASETPGTNYEIVCPDGAIIQWRVRTASENGYLGEWSTLRTIYVYENPQLTFQAYDLTDNVLETPFTLSALPLKFRGFVDVDSFKQKIIGYHVSITADKTHQVVNNQGETVTVYAGDTVYGRPFDDVDPDDPNNFEVTISAGDATFTNDISYTVSCTVTMDSGLTVTSDPITFSAVLAQTSYFLDAEISVDPDSYTATIRPYCTNADDGTPVENVLLYVYRREYNGDFTLISGDIDNTSAFTPAEGEGTYEIGLSNTFVTDPHPSLDYARYRIVAIDKDTGSTVYSDLPPYPVGCKSIILQWGETWTNFDATDEDEDEEFRSWSGEMLKLPYNIDISNSYSPDVALVEYIGREHPVDYYGTQRGESAIWNAVIKKDDQETIYSLRRLANHMGNVYVREPSGIGYRAHVKVSFGKKHLDVTIPVTLNITRVEGGK